MLKKIVCMVMVIILSYSFNGCASVEKSSEIISDETDNGTGTSANFQESIDIESDDENADEFVPLPKFDDSATIEETVLYDENNIRITAISLEYNYYSARLNLKFENMSEKNLEFFAETYGYSVNGINDYMIEDGYMHINVAAGESGEDYIEFAYNELYIHGITEIAEIQVGFDIQDEEYDDIYTEPLTIKTNIAENHNYEDSGYATIVQSKALKSAYGLDTLYFAQDKIYDSYEISIISEHYLINKNGERILILEVQNATDDTVYFKTNNITVNDISIYESTWNYESITANKKMLVTIDLDNILDEEEWQEKEISEIESIGFSLETYDDKYNMVSAPMELVINVK